MHSLKRQYHPLARYNAAEIVYSRPQDEIPWYRLADIKARVDRWERPIALVNGGFDLLHAGHMRLIFAAADHAKTVICALDSDAKIQRAKQRSPILPWHMRATALKFMPITGVIEIDTDGDFLSLVRALRPDLRVLSTEYSGRSSRVPKVPTIYVANRGPHTSDIIQRCQQLRPTESTEVVQCV